jgi:hypothetical protein
LTIDSSPFIQKQIIKWVSSIINLEAKDPPQDLSLPECQLRVFLPRLATHILSSDSQFALLPAEIEAENDAASS